MVVITSDGRRACWPITPSRVGFAVRSPAIPPVPGLAEAKPWTTREATSTKEVPPRLAVLGGGVAGCELAQAFDSLGSDVTVLEVGERLLASSEPFASKIVAGSMSETGIDVRTGTPSEGVDRTSSGTVLITLDDGELVVDEMLVAAGRKPRTDDIGLETVGLEPGSLAGRRRLDGRPRCRRRLALRLRRRQPPRAADPPGQVPGPRFAATGSRRGSRATSTRRPGASTAPPPTTGWCHRSSSPTPRSAAWA